MLNWLRQMLGRADAGSAMSRDVTRLPAGTRLYAIGDVHGRADLLVRLRDMIADDIALAAPAEARIVLVGDYVDRGPNSRGVLDMLTGEDWPAPIVPLVGNHEAMLLGFLDRPDTGENWRKFGGVETVHSYGVDVSQFRAGQDLEAVAESLRAAIPEEHLAFLRNLRLHHREGDYYFCHAGVRPGVPLEQQSPDDLLWIREDFVDSDEPFGAIVVHGHTPAERPAVRENAIGIDTGAYITGKLTAAVLASRGLSFLQT